MPGDKSEDTTAEFLEQYSALVRESGVHLVWTVEGLWDVVVATSEQIRTHLEDVGYSD